LPPLGLSALALQAAVLGVPAAVTPHWFFTWFPFGRGWVAAGGAYSPHMVADLGFLYLGLGTVLVWAAVVPTAQLVRAAATGSVLANLLHLVFHVRHTGDLPAGDAVAEIALLLAVVLIGIAVLILAYRPGRVSVTGP